MLDATPQRYSRLSPAEVAAASKQNIHATARGADECLLPVPSNAPRPLSPREAVGTWPYRDASGALLYLTHRFDNSDGKSFAWQTAWRTPSGAIGWKFRAPPSPRPIYGLDRLAALPESSVLIAEGEKAADAATRMFPSMVTVTSPGGAEAAAKADWSALRGRRALIWPDNDAPGETYAQTVAALLAGVASEVKIIDASALARTDPAGGEREPVAGWDAADAESEWGDKAALREALKRCVRS